MKTWQMRPLLQQLCEGCGIQCGTPPIQDFKTFCPGCILQREKESYELWRAALAAQAAPEGHYRNCGKGWCEECFGVIREVDGTRRLYQDWEHYRLRNSAITNRW